MSKSFSNVSVIAFGGEKAVKASVTLQVSR
jgi:hypothetical protein